MVEPVLGGQVGEFVSPWGGIVCETLGEGPPVVLLHELEVGGGRDEWQAVAPLLAAAGYQVMALDWLGCGDSAQPAERATAALCLDLLRTWSAEWPAPAHLIARGHAAAYAAVLAAEQPARCRSLTAIHPRGLRPPVVDEAVYAALSGAAGRAVYEAAVTDGALREWLAGDVFYGAAAADPERLRRLGARARRPGAERLAASLAAGLLAVDVRHAWIDAPQPILLVWGEACADPPLDDAEDFIMPLRPDAPFMMIDQRPVGVWKHAVTYKSFADCRQRPHEEAAEAVAQPLIEHLRRADQAAEGSAPAED